MKRIWTDSLERLLLNILFRYKIDVQVRLVYQSEDT